jgi:periplasmic protein TonB
MRRFSVFFLACSLLAGLTVSSVNAQESDAPPPKKITRIRQGGNITAKMLIHKVQPKYPQEAVEERIEGTVRLHAVIGRDGSVAQLEIVSGYPALASAALDAVRQWKYRPSLLNGEPVEVDTTIDVIFSLRR